MGPVVLKPQRPTLAVRIGDAAFDVPLTFTRRELEELGAADDKAGATNDFMAKYLGDAFEELGDDDLRTLINAWTDARKEIGAPDTGESTALPK